MGLFKKNKTKRATVNPADSAALAQRSLDFIAEAVLVIDARGMIKFANPAAAAMTGYGDPNNITGLDYQLVIHLEDAQEKPIESNQTLLYTAIFLNQSLRTREYILVATQSGHRIAIDLSCIPTGDTFADRIVTFRDITNELAEEREQAEFISTASHEMRTPVASIEGYLGLCLNPQTATVDERARKYLDAAHAASKHLGHLFKDLLDVTKIDDSRANIHLVPLDATEAVSFIVDEQSEAMQAKNIRYTFGGQGRFSDKKHLTPKIYMAVDYDFLHEIVDNLVGNAIKYTPEGGEIKVSVKGEGDKVLITVTDTGIGIPSEDIGHIFQKFYRVDNTQTREIGGTGLGLYLVKQRAEALGGRVWVESDFGHGSSFFVTLPRITESEYEKMRIAYGNEKMMRTPFVAPVVGTAAPKSAEPNDLAVNTTASTADSQILTVAPAASLENADSATIENSTETTAPTRLAQPAASATPKIIKTKLDRPVDSTLSPLIQNHAKTLEEPASESLGLQDNLPETRSFQPSPSQWNNTNLNNNASSAEPEPQIFEHTHRTIQPLSHNLKAETASVTPNSNNLKEEKHE